MSQSLLQLAILNNISWCSKICGLHGSQGERTDELWTNRHKSPPYYPNIITAKPDCQTIVLAAVEKCRQVGITGTWGIKDSFGDLDLTGHGFVKAIDGNWFVRKPLAPMYSSSIDWRIVRESELDHWVSAWHGMEGAAPDIFKPEVLHETTIAIVARFSESAIIAGGIFDRSEGVSGLSNWFGPPNNGGVPDGLLDAVPSARLQPTVCWSDMPVETMATSGFAPIGPMAVWINQR